MLVHDWLGCHRDDGFWSRWAVAQCTVGSFGIVVFSPFFDDDLGFAERVKDLAVEQFIAEPRVEAFAVSILPSTAWQGIAWRCPERGDPGSM